MKRGVSADWIDKEFREITADDTKAYIGICITTRLSINQSINHQSNLYSANIPGEARAQWRDRQISVQQQNRLDPKASVEDYWSTDPVLGNEYIKATMSRCQFVNLTRYFHIDSPRNDPARIANTKQRTAAVAADLLSKKCKRK